jgi:hypothetical protein
MPKVTVKEFSAMTGVPPKNIHRDAGRSKVVKTADGCIDTFNEVNAAYLAKNKGRADNPPPSPTPKSKPSKKAAPSEPDEEDEESDTEAIVLGKDGLMTLTKSEKVYQHARALKNQKDVEIRDMEIAKMKGEVIPSAPIATIVYQLKQYWLTQAKIAFEKALVEIGHKYELESEDLAFYRGNNTKLLNDAMTASSLDFSNNLENILSQFSLKKA